MPEMKKIASIFMEELFHVYLKERDFEKFTSMLDENINWLSIKKKNPCQNINQLKLLLEKEKDYQNVKFNITKFNTNSIEISEELCVVYGEIGIQSDEYKLLIADKSVFYAVCRLESLHTLKLTHLIFSRTKKILNKKKLAKENEMSSESEYINRLEKIVYEQTEKSSEELLISEKKFEAMVRHSHAIVYDYILETDEMILPKDFAEKYDLPLKFKNATSDPVWRNILHKDSYNAFQKIHAFARKGVSEIYETIFAQDKYGNTTNFDVYVRSIRNKDGIPVKALVILTDVTDNTSNYNVNQNSNKVAQVNTDNSRLYEIMLARSENVYEVNISKNILQKGQEYWLNKYGIKPEDSYTQFIRKVAKYGVNKDDLGNFLKVFDRDNAIIEYIGGNKEIACEYRRPNEKGKTIWVRSTLYLYEDANTGDVKAVINVEDINEEKLHKLELIYCAEHDQLTKLYNKVKTQQAIDEFLCFQEGKSGQHAFFIIDLDYFKEVNDTLGHAFGDAVLSNTTSKIKALFRDDDILGRIGGDEFVVFMKNISGPKDATSKAKELCNAIKDVYKQNQKTVPISASVGIAYYPNHAKDYKELYKLSDIALYAAKENGRNRYFVYNKDLIIGEKKEKPIASNDYFEIHSFESDPSEYIFRILYETDDKTAAINTVLELVGKHFKASRAYIFEKDNNSESFSNTFEWCAQNIEPKKEIIQKISSEGRQTYVGLFNEHGICYLPDIESTDDVIKKMFENLKVKSVLQFVIKKHEKIHGIIGFDYCENKFNPSKREITMLNSISNMLGIFVEQIHALKAAEEMRDITVLMLNNLDSSIYISDKETYKILFMNKNAQNLIKNTKPGDLCYKVFRNKDEPCNDCPMETNEDSDAKYYLELKNEQAGINMYVSTKLIYWINGRKACMHECVKTSYFNELKSKCCKM